MTKEELKKEAIEWVKQKFPMLDLKQSDMSKIYEYEAYLAGAEPREEHIADLEKEKQNLIDENKKTFNDWLEACNKYGEVNLKLTKAKELLNEFMRISKASDEDFEHDYSELIGETEQFINEIEK